MVIRRAGTEMSSYEPLVSIVTPVYNGSAYLEELIASVLAQDYPRIEHIVIDDGSDDAGKTVAILQNYSHLRWWSRANRGAYATMNEGLAASVGELVTVICADDKYACPTAISAAVACFGTAEGCDAVYGETPTIDENGCVIAMEGPRSGPLWMFPYYQVVSHCSLLVKRKRLMEANLLFDESLPYSADFDWIMKMIKGGFRFHSIRRPVAMFRRHGLQRSQDVSEAREGERRVLRLRYGHGNRFVACLVRQWVRLIVVKNLAFRRGFVACLVEVVSRLKHGRRHGRRAVSAQ